MKALLRDTLLFCKQYSPIPLYLGLILTICFFVLTVSVQAAPGDIDITFGGGGRVFSPFTQNAQSNAVLIQADGKIIVAGGGKLFSNSIQDFALARYFPNGLIDTSFGNNGVVLTNMRTSQFGGAASWITDAALLPDGKIVVVGSAAYYYGAPFDGSVFGIARYLSNGTLDSSFDGDGKVFFGSNSDAATSVKVQADGKILVAGTLGRCPDCTNPTRFAILRFNDDGSRDSSFGGGSVISRFSPQGDSHGDFLALQPDGKVIIAGDSGSNFGIARYNTDGTLDSSFGGGGIVLIPYANLESGTNMITQPDGKIIVLANGSGNNSDFVVLRFDRNGTPDTGFGDNGKITTAVSTQRDVANHVVYQPDGKLIVTGSSYNSNNSSDIKAAVVRYQSDGSLDPTFGDGGIVFTPNYSIFRSALQPDGKLVTINNYGFNIVRYHGDAPYAQSHKDFDFTGDGLADFAVVRDVDGYFNWYTAGNPALKLVIDQEWGTAADKIVPADYDGDGKTDVAVFRNGNWYWINSSNGTFNAYRFGTDSDIPVPADYTGDGRAELAVYRGGFWYTLNLADNQFQAAVQFGISTDKPVPADYDGDGKTDFAVYRDGVWFMLRSTAGFTAVQFGIASDKPTVGDYDGDSKADQAVYRSGVWHILGSTQGFSAVQFGSAGDIPVAADYDGDGKTDIAVFREGIWYLLRSQQGFGAVQFGTANDKPIPSAYLP